MIGTGFQKQPGAYPEKVKAFMSHIKKEIPGNDKDHYDFTSTRTKKRTDIAINGIKTAKAKLKDVCDESLIESYFAVTNFLIMRGGYNDGADYLNQTTLASAIWILDQLTLQGKLQECYPFLPDVSDGSVFSELNMAFPNHPVYDLELISSMVMLIRQRNTSKKFKYADCGTLQWDQGFPDKDEQSSNNRRNFDSVISLIDADAIKSAVDNYEKDVWHFYRLSFEAYSLIEKRISKLEKEVSESDVIAPVEAVQFNNPLIPLEARKANAPDFLKSFLLSGAEATRLNKLQCEMDWLKRITFTQISLVNDREKTARKLKGIIPDELADNLIHFHVDDPFESAFALMYMLDTGSDIPWFYYGSISVAYAATDQLPFDTKQIVPGKPVLLSEFNKALYEHKYCGYRWPDVTDASMEPVKRTYANNLSQLLYTSSATLFPRVISRIPDLDKYIQGLGDITPDEQEAYTLLLYSLHADALRTYTESLDSYRLEQELQVEGTSKITDNKSVEEDKENYYKSECERLRNKNERLISALHESTRYRNAHSGEIEFLKDEVERQRRELADLRERVFLSESGEEIAETEDRPIQYPYHTSGRILSFGGTASWVNEMKKKLPDVIFISADTLPNVDLIRGADEVWIQVNCISHSNYYKIMESLGSTEKQVRYFVYSGVTKCAEQMVKAKEI